MLVVLKRFRGGRGALTHGKDCVRVGTAGILVLRDRINKCLGLLRDSSLCGWCLSGEEVPLGKANMGNEPSIWSESIEEGLEEDEVSEISDGGRDATLRKK